MNWKVYESILYLDEIGTVHVLYRAFRMQRYDRVSDGQSGMVEPDDVEHLIFSGLKRECDRRVVAFFSRLRAMRRIGNF